MNALLDAGADIEARDTNGWTPLHSAAASGTAETVNALLDAGADIEARDTNGWTPLHSAAAIGTAETVNALLNAGADIEAQVAVGLTPLRAAASGTAETVNALLDAGADIEARDTDGWTLLHYAAASGTAETVNALLDAGADIEARNTDGWTPLHLAANNGTAETVNALLNAGADIEAQGGKYDETPLHLAAVNGATETANALLNAGADIEAREGEYDRTPLHVAAVHGTAETVNALLNAGADIEARNTGRRTPLHFAAGWGTGETVDALLNAGADIEARDTDGWTPLHSAASNGTAETVNALLNAGADIEAQFAVGLTPLRAAASGTAETVNALLNAGADIEARDTDGWTLLHYAAASGTAETVNALLNAGADIEARNTDGWTPLHPAANNGTGETVNALLNAGADIEAQGGKYDKTPLHVAALNGATETVNALLNAGADIEARDTEGWTPLHSAADAGTAETVNALLNAGADIEARNTGRRTPLHFAAGWGTGETVNALLNAGADIEAQGTGGLTSLHYAARDGTAETVNALLNAGADIEARNTGRRTPLHYAAGWGATETVNALLNAGANVDAPDTDEETPLHFATRYGTTEKVNALLNAGTDTEARGKYDRILLHNAARDGTAETVNALLNTGANVDAKDTGDHTPLHYAAGLSIAETVKSFLLNEGANAEALDDIGWTPLHFEARYGTVETVNALLNAGADIEARGGSSDWTPLHSAAEKGTAEIVHALLNAGADIEAQGTGGLTPLHYAARDGTAETVNALLNAGADIEARVGEYDRTPLHFAAEHGTAETVNALLNAGADIEARDTVNWTPLSLAAGLGTAETVNALLNAGADIEARAGKYDKTPLHFAADAGTAETVNALLNAGADIEARAGKYDKTPLHFAADAGTAETVNALLNAGADIEARAGKYDRTPLHFAAEHGTAETVNALLNAGADIEARDTVNWTPLSLAVGWGTGKTVEALLNAGADIEARSGKNDKTPLHRAAEHGTAETVNALLNAGADIEARGGKYDRTPLHAAAENGTAETVNALLNAGADIEARGGKYDRTPLHAAAENGTAETVNALLNAGADIEARAGKYDRTPLHAAAENGTVETVNALLNADANTEARDHTGQTSMHYTAWGGTVDAMMRLKAQGADINARNDTGQTPMHYAAANNAVYVLKWLKAQKADINVRDDAGQTPMHYAERGGAVDAMTWLKANSPDTTGEEKFEVFRLHINSLASHEHDDGVSDSIQIEAAVETTVTSIKDALIPEVFNWRQIQTIADGLSLSMTRLNDNSLYYSVPRTVAERLVIKERNPQYKLVGLSLLDEMESGVSADSISEFVGIQFQLPEAKSIQKKLIKRSLQAYDNNWLTAHGWVPTRDLDYGSDASLGVYQMDLGVELYQVESLVSLISQIDRDEKLRQMLLDSGLARLNYAFATLVMEGMTPRGRSESRAFEHFSVGADEKHVPSMFRVGLMTEHGLGTEADLEAALQIHRRAVEVDENTSASSALLLAERFEVGDNVERDWAMATHYYTKAFTNTNLESAAVAQVIYGRLVDQTGYWSESEDGGELLRNFIDDAKGIASELGRLFADASNGQTFDFEESVHWLRLGGRDSVFLLRDILRLRPDLAENALEKTLAEQIPVPEWAAHSDPSIAMDRLKVECRVHKLVDFLRNRYCADFLKKASLGFYNQNLIETAFAHLEAISDIELEQIETLGSLVPRSTIGGVVSDDITTRSIPEYTYQLVDVLAFFGDYKEAERRARIVRGGTIAASLEPLRRQVVRSLESGEVTEGLHALLNTLARQGNSSARDLLAALHGQINRSKPVLDIAVARERFEAVTHMANSVSFAKNARQLAPLEADAGNPERAVELEMMALKSDLTRSAVARFETGPIGKTLSDVCNLSKTSQRLFSYDEREIALVLAKQAVNRLQEIRLLVSGLPERLRLCFRAQVESHYRWMAGLLLAQERPQEVSRVLEMLKSFESFEFANRTRELAGDAFATLSLSDAEQSFWDALSNLVLPNSTNLSRLATLRNLGTVRSLTSAEQLEITLLEAQLDAKIRERQSELRTVSEAVRQVPEAKTPDSSKEGLIYRYLQSPKNRSTAILQYVVGKDWLGLVLTTYGSQNTWTWDRFGDKDFSKDKINTKVAMFRDAVSDRGRDPRKLGQQLYDLLLPDEVKTVLSQHEIDTLVFSLDRHLRYVPIAALHDGTQWLSEQYVLSHLSAGTVPDRSETQKNGDIIAGFGTTGSFHGLPALPAVLDELKAIVQESADDPGYLRGTARLDQDFTRSSLASALSFGSSAASLGGVLHLASHFEVGQTESDSKLLLGDGDFLSVREIREGLSPGADSLQEVSLLTLSACNTGFGKPDADGRELESFAAVAQQKGAGAVLASVLKVPDRATSELMNRFYENYAAGLPPARALKEAQNVLMSGKDDALESPNAVVQGRRHPFYWASFVLLEGSL